MKKELNKFFVHPNSTLKEGMQAIDLNGYGVALITDDKKKLLGLVTDGDIRRAIIKGTGLDAPINNIMNISPHYLNDSTDVRELFNFVIDKKIAHLPVLDENKFILDLLIGKEIHNTLSKKILESTKDKPDAKRKHILVVGGAGYIGSVLVRQLLEKGHKVKVLDKLIFGKNSLAGLEKNEDFFLTEDDIGHIETIIEAIKDVDAVVQLAEIVGDPACAADPQKTQQVNHLSTQLLANICKYFQINRFIYASSCSVYGASRGDELLTEDSELNPISLYSRMKLESEKIILNMADGTFSPTILRFATVFGESPRMRFDLVINILTAKAIKEKKITIFGGDQWRPFVHVSDAAKSIIFVLEAPLHKIKGEVFNVGSNENNSTINDIGKFVKEVIPSAKLIIEEKDVDKRDYKVDFSKIKNMLDFKADISILEGIKEISASLEDKKYENYQDDLYYNYKTYQKISNKNQQT